MDDEVSSDLLARAAAAYPAAVADPCGFGAEAARLVGEARRAGDAEALVLALRAKAWSERGRLANGPAKELLDEAARVARRQRLDDRLGEVLVTRAAVNHELGRLGAAQRDLDRATPLLGKSRSPELDLQQAALYQNIGRLSDAAGLYRRLLADRSCPPDVRAKVANNLALIEAHRGHPDVALGYLDQAAAAAAGIGPALVAIVAQSRGWVTAQAGRLTEGLRQFDEAARLYEAAGLPLGEHYLEYVDVLAELWLLPEAGAIARRAIAQFEANGVLLMGAEAQLRAARLALLSGDHAQAVAAATQAAAEFRRQRRTAWSARAEVVAVEARAHSGAVGRRDLTTVRRAAALLQGLGMPSSAVEAHLTTGRVAMALGREAAALDSLDRAHQLARRGPVLVRVKGRVAGALAAQLRHDDRGLLRHCRLGLTDLERHRGALASMELRALASRHGAELGRLGLAVLRRTAPAPRVLEWMERTRAAAISAVEPPTTDGIEQDLAALRAVHAELGQVRRDTGSEPPNLVAKQTAIESRIRRVTWARQASAEVRGAAASRTVELRELLDGQVLVEYGVLGGRLFAAVLEPRRTRLVELGTLEAVQHEADALAFALRRLARPRSPAGLGAARASADAALQRLTALLMRPLRVPDDVGLVIVPLSELQHIPWSALHRAPLSLAPSASMWARSRRRALHADSGTVLVAGPGLPGAAVEIEALSKLHDQPTVLVPPASTVGAVAAALDHAELAHLACHAQLRVDNPIFSTLVLSDGPLTVHELDLRGVAPRRLVLAACDSGADVSYAENEMLGFVSALFARGTAGLVASVVTVPDLDAVRLMCFLHERLRGHATLADALYAARGLLDQDNPGEFVNWCGFNAFGAA